MTKVLIPTENKKKNKAKHKNATKTKRRIHDMDRLRTDSLSNDSHQTVVVTTVYGTPTFFLTIYLVLQNL